MHKLLVGLKALALGAVTLVCLGGVAIELQVIRSERRIEAGIALVLSGVAADVQQTGNLVSETQQTVMAVHRSLTIQPIDKLLHDARFSLDQINRAALDERLYFEQDAPLLSQQAQGVLKNVQTATADLHPLIVTTTTRIAALDEIERNTSKTIRDLDTTANDPAIVDALRNIDATSQSTAQTAVHVEHMAAEGEAEVHKFTHPKPLVSIADWTLKVVHALGGWF